MSKKLKYNSWFSFFFEYSTTSIGGVRRSRNGIICLNKLFLYNILVFWITCWSFGCKIAVQLGRINKMRKLGSTVNSSVTKCEGALSINNSGFWSLFILSKNHLTLGMKRRLNQLENILSVIQPLLESLIYYW